MFGKLINLSDISICQLLHFLKTCPSALDPGRTMLGAAQEKWLFDNLPTAKSRWTVLSQQVYSFARDNQKVDPNARFNMDTWDGYVAARTRLYSRLKETRAPNPIVISGNAGPTVRQSTYPKERVLAYVMPPDYVLEEIAKVARANARATVSATTTVTATTPR